MNIIEAIKTRRTIYDFLPDRVPDPLLSQILETGIYAPNHKLTEPWRFTVIGRMTQSAIAEIHASAECAALAPEQAAAKKQQLIDKLMAKPTIVVASCVKSEDPQRQIEDLLAVGCAIQNIQLAAWANGVGCQWGTGKITRSPEVIEQLGIADNSIVVGFIYLGYPTDIPQRPRKTALSDTIRWMR